MLQVFVLFTSLSRASWCLCSAVLPFFWYWGILLPVALGAQIGEVGYACVTGFFNCPRAGERIRGSSLMVTILPVLHTGQRHGFMPVSRAKRSTFVSGGCCFLISVKRVNARFLFRCKL